MAAASAHNGAGGTVVVHLSQVPAALRDAVASKLADAWLAAGGQLADAMAVRRAAVLGRPDVAIEVPAWKAERVLGGKQVLGGIPGYLLEP